MSWLCPPRLANVHPGAPRPPPPIRFWQSICSPPTSFHTEEVCLSCILWTFWILHFSNWLPGGGAFPFPRIHRSCWYLIQTRWKSAGSLSKGTPRGRWKQMSVGFKLHSSICSPPHIGMWTRFACFSLQESCWSLALDFSGLPMQTSNSRWIGKNSCLAFIQTTTQMGCLHFNWRSICPALGFSSSSWCKPCKKVQKLFYLPQRRNGQAHWRMKLTCISFRSLKRQIENVFIRAT